MYAEVGETSDMLIKGKNTKSEYIFTKSTDEEAYNTLLSFFENTWGERLTSADSDDSMQNDNKKYKYRVYTARKCFELNEMFFNLCRQDKQISPELLEKCKVLRGESFITQHALMLATPELVNNFCKYSEFPPILICDELAVFGHKIARLVSDLEDAVIEAMSTVLKKELDDDEQYYIKKKLLSAIDIRVFCGEQTALQIPDRIRKRIKFEYAWPKNEWHCFIQIVNKVLNQTTPFANKSYLPVLLVDDFGVKNAVEKNGWSYREYKYCDVSMRIWQKSRKTESGGVYLHQAVCLREYGDAIYFLPMVFFGDIQTEQAEDFAQRLADALSLGEDNKFAEILKRESSEILYLKYQFIIFVLSLITFCDYYNECSEFFTDSNVKIFELEKVCMNFGCQNEYLSDLKAVYNGIMYEDNSCRSIREELYSFFECFARPLKVGFGEIEKDGNLKDAISDAENVLCAMARKNEAYSSAMREFDGVFGTSTPDYSIATLAEYLDRNHNHTIDDAFAALIIMLNVGIISSNTQMSDDKSCVQMRIKEGELSDFIETSRVADYIPELIVLEKFCFLFGFDIADLAHRNGDHIGDDGSKLEYFVRSQYSTGNRMRDWLGACLDCSNGDVELSVKKTPFEAFRKAFSEIKTGEIAEHKSDHFNNFLKLAVEQM